MDWRDQLQLHSDDCRGCHPGLPCALHLLPHVSVLLPIHVLCVCVCDVSTLHHDDWHHDPLRRFAAKFDVWRRQGIPTPNPYILYFKSVSQILSSNFMTLELRQIAKYGTVYGYADAVRANLVVADPDILKDMLIRHFSSFVDRRPSLEHPVIAKQLVLMSGDEWRQTRAIMSPTFTSRKMKAMFSKIRDAVEQMRRRLDRDSGKEVDLKDLFGCLTMDVIAKCAFAVDSNAHEDANSPFVVNAKAFFSFSRWRLAIAVAIPRFLRSLLGISFFNKEPLQFLEGLARTLIQERRRHGSTGGGGSSGYTDFLQLLLDAGTQSQEQSQSNEQVAETEKLDDDEDARLQAATAATASGKKTLTDDEIVANIILVLVAGYETTASLLTYACYSLACNPDMQQRLRQEVTACHTLDYETVMKLPYLDAVVSESLRMYPPVLRVERQVSDKTGYTYDGGDKDGKRKRIHMPHGSAVILPIYAMHHMKELFPDPESFLPQRFLPENKDSIVPYSFVPFVMGPRNCIGMRFALLEAKLTLATLMTGYRFSVCSKTDVPLDFSKTFVLLQPKRVIVRIDKLRQVDKTGGMTC